MNLLRKALLLLLLIPWGPAQAAARTPNVILTIQVAPANACIPRGQAGQDAMTAGFTTTALCNDFTTPIPNSVGTGLPSNWLDCNHDSSTSSVWYWNFPLFGGSGSQPPCSGHVAWNVIDPVNGNYALTFTLTDNDISTYGFPVSGMSTINWDQTNPTPGSGQYGYAYYEYTFRVDNPAPLTATLWSWVDATAQTLAAQSSGLIELDFMESYACSGCPSTDFGLNHWQGGKLSFSYLSQGSGLPLTTYHTWGLLFTGDGGNNFSVCSYVDGARNGCKQQTYDLANENLQRRYLMTWLQNNIVSGGIGTVNMYEKNIKVLTCSNWQGSDATGMCAGSKLNSTGFYQ